ncbi:XRE family transcriptional regulator [Pseudomonas putida]|uniref:helix-turn-helix domain-containing protein n=1 Tax=Pseudomonas putida TaxID=303 RepID=UPI00105A68D8|nr:helix-turn-helix transcriptional regulator [Pseudomonas putida]TDJ76977.1 XRE family transcriptional regulator [Pseudomonas putida]
MHLLEEIGARLQAERKRLDLTQDQMAALVGVSKRTLASYEAGTREAGALLLNLAVGAGVDVLFVLTGVPSPQAADSLSTGEAQLVERYRRMSHEAQGTINSVSEALATFSK